MPLVSTPALVLQAFPYSDTSKILRLLTPEHGLRSAIARGALRPKSRYGGLLEPFTQGVAQVYLKEGRELHTLSAFDLVRSRQSLGRDLAAFAGASLLAELVLRAATEEPAPELFHSVVHALDAIAAAPAAEVEVAVFAAVWGLVGLLGYRPRTAECVGCGQPLAPDESVRFDVEGGGAACARCRPAGRTLDATSRRELEAMLRGGFAAARFERPGLQRALLRAYLSAHLGQERPLRSLPLLLQQLP